MAGAEAGNAENNTYIHTYMMFHLYVFFQRGYEWLYVGDLTCGSEYVLCDEAAVGPAATLT